MILKLTPRRTGATLVVLACLSMSQYALADDSDAQQSTLACLQGFLETGSADLTLGEMRERCAPALAERPENPVEQRIVAEREAAARPFSLLAHKSNYVLLGAWNQRGWNPDPFREAENDPNYQFDDWEVQFQLSFKVPLAVNLLDGRMDVYAAYTNRSFWQAYNQAYSQPFRETNHEPEVWAQFHNDWELFGVTNALNRFGYVHQSNGQSEPLSRGWDRLYADFIFEKNHFVVGIKPWLWLDKTSDEDNPDIDEYLGHGELRLAWTRARHETTLMLRNQIESGFERGAVELGWTFPLFDYPYAKGFIQYFYGYGESLIDYDQRVNRLGLGLSFSGLID